jgi:dehydrogenase/reductase SDR family protein 7B
MNNLQNKVIWLTGASSGIGEALAYALAKEGAKLILSARREDELQRVANNTKLRVADYLVLPLDLNAPETFDAKKSEAIKKFGRIDILVNNGGVSQRSLAKDTSIEVDRKIMEVNYFGTIALTKALLPDFIKQKDGLFVVVSSAVGKFGSPWRSGYSASKHALHGFFDSLRAELYNDGIKVLLVCPGFIQTNVSINALTGTGSKLGSMDVATANGLTADECARQIISAIKSGKEEIVVAKFKERFAVFAKRFFPGIFSAMIKKMAVR